MIRTFKGVHLVSLLVSLTFATFAFASVQDAGAWTRITIDNDRNDCLNGWISMDVRVDVDGESFSFDPSCSFSFSQSFSTRAGVSCRADAGMCSSFSPYHQFEVTCGTSREYVDISCPP